MADVTLTPRQREILEVIEQHQRDRGFPPSVREIGEAVGLTSPSTVHAHLATLQRLGFLRRDPTKPRAIEVRFDATSGAPVERRPVRHVPLVGDVAAGTDVLAQENIEETLPLPADFTGEGDLFMLRVRGDSMVEAAIVDGDVSPTASPISRTDGGKPRSRWCCSMTSRISRCRGVRVTSAIGPPGAIQVFGQYRTAGSMANTRSAHLCSIGPLTANGRSGVGWRATNRRSRRRSRPPDPLSHPLRRIQAMSSAAALQLAPRRQPTTPPPGTGPSRPALRVLEGGRAPGRVRQQAVYRRRRVVAAAALVLVTVVTLLLANAVVARSAGGGTPVPAAGTSSSAVHVVQPGDTLWSVAAELAPGRDVRITGDQLRELNGGAPLVVGQRLLLP